MHQKKHTMPAMKRYFIIILTLAFSLTMMKLVAEITGVVAVYDDMCINSCHAFTRSFAQLKSCSTCGEARYDAAEFTSSGKEVPCQQCFTVLLGPQLQALH